MVVVVKVISLSNEAYELLKKMKGKRSFSEVIMEKLGPRKPSILDICGKWRGGKEGLDKLEAEIMKTRKTAKMREVKF